MEKRRSKKRNYLTNDKDLAELAYVLHVNADRLTTTATAINVPAEFRMRLLRQVQAARKLARSLSAELDKENDGVFETKKSTEQYCELIGLF